jgi:cob(I)alamin adenosyltransferase
MPIRINKVYTRTGDKGETHLVGGKRVAKDDPRIESYGTIDELNAILGIVRAFNDAATRSPMDAATRTPTDAAPTSPIAARLDAILRQVQNELFDLGSELATPPEAEWEGMIRVGDEQVKVLERTIDECQEDLEPLKSFILPGGGTIAAFLHQARTVCRRAERDILRLRRRETIGDGPLRYVNRLSDLLFVLSRWVSKHLGEPEYLWEKGLTLPAGGPKRARATSAAPSRSAGATPASRPSPAAPPAAKRAGGASTRRSR